MPRLVRLCMVIAFAIGFPVFAKPLLITDLSKPLNLTKNVHQFTLQLPSNVTTGYRWVLAAKYSSQLISPVKQTYVASHKNSLGGGGFEYWTFRLAAQAFVVPTRFTLQFDYLRPWEGKVTKTKTIQVITE